MRGETATLVTGQFVEEEETSEAGGGMLELVDGRRVIDGCRRAKRDRAKGVGTLKGVVVVAGQRMAIALVGERRGSMMERDWMVQAPSAAVIRCEFQGCLRGVARVERLCQ